VKATVLFVCKDNSALSPIAEAILTKLGSHSFEAHSAGINPLFIEPLAVEVMAEIGVDLSQHRPRSVGEFISTPINHLIYLSGSEADEEPSFPCHSRRAHGSLRTLVLKLTGLNHFVERGTF
jgi:arsenate reductase (thioredoxin)